MGQDVSKSTISQDRLVDAIGEAYQKVFPTDIIDLARLQPFVSSLFESKENITEQLRIPNSDMILAMIKDYSNLTVATDEDSVLKKVVLPLLNGRKEMKPQEEQILMELFTYLKERSNLVYSSYEAETNKREDFRVGLLQSAISAHRKVSDPGFLIEEILNSELSETELVCRVSDFSKKFNGSLQFHNSYSVISEQLSMMMLENEYEDIIYTSLEWGFVTYQLSSILDSFLRLIKLESKKFSKNNPFSFQSLEKIYNDRLLTNAAFSSFPEDIITSATMYDFIPTGSVQSSFMATDGDKLYILGNGKTLTSIDISRKPYCFKDRFLKTEIQHMNQVSGNDICLGYGNGTLLFYSTAEPTHTLWATEINAKVQQDIRYCIYGEFEFLPQCTAPFASDGKNLYSFNAPNLMSVFLIERPKLYLKRQIRFQKGIAALEAPFSDSLFPQEFTKGMIVITNGIIITFLKYLSENQGKHQYFARHFSLMTSEHLLDSRVVFECMISSMIYDPWNKCFWAISNSNNGVLYRIPSFYGTSPWVLGINHSMIGKPKYNPDNSTHMLVAENILEFLDYITTHYHGFSFYSSRNNAFYNIHHSLFIAPSNSSTLDIIINTIEYLCEAFIVYNEPISFWKKYEILRALSAFIKLLDINLTNYDTRYPYPDSMVSKSIYQSKSIINICLKIITNQEFLTIRPIVFSLLINSLDILFSNNPEDLIMVISIFLKNNDKNIIITCLPAIIDSHLFISCFSCDSFTDIFDSIIANYSMEQNSIIKTLFDSYFIEVMSKVKLLSLKVTNKLNCQEQTVYDIFIKLSKTICSHFVKQLSSINSNVINESVIIPSSIIFEKWIMMIHPFSSSYLLLMPIVLILHDIFIGLTDFQKNYENIILSVNNNIIIMAFYSCYFDYVYGLMNHSSELERSSSFHWLLHNTFASDVTLESIGQIYQTILNTSPQKIQHHSLIKGLSFNLHNKNSNTRLAQDFFQSLLAFKPHQSIDTLYVFLNSCIPNPGRQQSNTNDTHLERLILAAFSKQLGLSNELYEISMFLQTSKTDKPAVSHFIKQCIQEIQMIRRNIRFIYQRTHLYQKNFSDKESSPSAKLSENYSLFCEIMKKKCLFLAHIEPCLRYHSSNWEAEFPIMIKKISKFLNDEISLEAYFEIINQTKEAQKGITVSLQFLYEIFSRLSGKTGVYMLNYLMEKFSNVESLDSYVLSIKESVLENILDQKEVATIKYIIELAVSFFENNHQKAIFSNSNLTFISRMFFTISHIDPLSIINPINRIMNILFTKRSCSINSMEESFATYFMSVLYFINKKTSNADYKKYYLDSFNYLVNMIGKTTPRLIRILYRPGMLITIESNHLIRSIEAADISDFSYMFPMLTDILHVVDDRIALIYWTLKQISTICSGGKPSIQQHLPLLYEKKLFSNTSCRTPEIILSCCSFLISFIREILKDKDNSSHELVKNVFGIILTKYNDQNVKVTGLYELFNDPILPFGVFCILSNVINLNGWMSIIKELSSSSLYYVSRIDYDINQYQIWQLPLSSVSVQKDQPISDSFQKTNSCSFSVSMYSEFSKLLPIFQRFLYQKYKKPFEFMLSYYIFSSMKEYSENEDFQKALLSNINVSSFSDVTVEDHTEDFLPIIKSLVSTTSVGAFQYENTSIELRHISLSPLSESLDVKFDKNSVYSKSGVHSFLSTPCSSPYFYELTISYKGSQSFDFGLINPSVYEPLYQNICYSQRNGSAKLTGKINRSLTSKEMSKTIIACFDGLNKRCSIKSNDGSTVLATTEFDSSDVFFFLVVYSGSSISYSIKSSMNSPDNQTRSLVFRNSNKHHQKKSKDIRVVNKKEHEIPENNIWNGHRYIEVVPCKSFQSPPITDPFVKYPSKLLETFYSALTTKPPKTIGSHPIYNILNHSTTECFPIVSNELTHYLNSNKHDCIKRKYNLNCSVSVNPYNGKIIKSQESSFQPCMYLPVFHPNYYSILPTDFLCIFVSGLSSVLRNTLISKVVLNTISQHPNGVEALIKEYHFNNESILRRMLYLICYVEVFSSSCIEKGLSPIDFNCNIFDTNSNVSKHSQYQERIASKAIYDFISSENNFASYIDLWFRSLVRMFSHSHSYTVNECHPYARVISSTNLLSTPYQITDSKAENWIVFCNSTLNDQNFNYIINTPNGSTLTFSSGLHLIEGQSLSLSFLENSEPNIFVFMIPLYKESNVTLCGTFYDLIVSFKYFVLLLSSGLKKMEFSLYRQIKQRIYACVMDSIIAGFPFFNSFSKDILKFLIEKLPLMGSDLTDGLLHRINFASYYIPRNQNKHIQGFLDDIQVIWDEKQYIFLKHFFPYFMSEADRLEILNLGEPVFALPSNQIGPNFDEKCDYKALFQFLKRVFLNNNNHYSYPFHQLLLFWARYVIEYPKIEISIISEKEIRIVFVDYNPGTISVICNNNSVQFMLSGNNQYLDAQVYKPGNEYKNEQRKELFLKLINDDCKLDGLVFVVCSLDRIPEDQYVLQYSESFVRDISYLINDWNIDFDQQILQTISSSRFKESNISIRIQAHTLLSLTNKAPINVLCLRAHMLEMLNWFYFHIPSDLSEDPVISKLLPSISAKLKIESFRAEIVSKSTSTRPEINIDRKKSIEVRDGISHDYNNTMIAQMVKAYKNPQDFRCNSAKPWEVNFTNEMGIDAGGPARELVSDLILDFTSINCGLVIYVPNHRNGIDHYKEYVIPLPNPSIENSKQRYRVAGACMAICARTELVQPINFPPLVWKFLVSGFISIESIFEIDNNYKHLIESLQEAYGSNMTEAQFAERFNQKFVILNSLGVLTPLTPNGKTELVTKQNCLQFISLANEFRINELKDSLTALKDGFWENLDFAPSSKVDSYTLEYAVCGENEISFEAMKKTTSFEGINADQQDILLRVIEALTSHQRSLLLKFSSGRLRLPPVTDSSYLKIDNGNGTDVLPTASTCFHQLHVPTFTSFEKAYKLIVIAIEYTGSFELR